jgi:DNA-binding SARP family transcriptional activator
MASESSPHAGTRTRVQLCGRFVVRLRGERVEHLFPGRQGRMLFAFLASRPSRTATRDEMLDALWHAGLPSAPELAISALLSKLRATLGEAALEGRKDITLHLPADALIDVESAVNAIHRAEALVSGARWAEAAGPTLTAYSISERQFLRGDNAPWIDDVRRRLESVNVRAMECYARIGLGVGGAELPVAVQSSRRLVELAPYRESGYCLLMRALEAQGNVVEALRVYEDLRVRLRDELGASPATEAAEIYRRLLART